MGKPTAMMLGSHSRLTSTDIDDGDDVGHALACMNILSCGLSNGSSNSQHHHRAGINALLKGTYYNGNNKKSDSMTSSSTATTMSSSTTDLNLNIDTHDTDALLAREINDLSLEQRDRVLNEIHGVASDIVETPELIESSLTQLQEEILKIRKRSAYDRAAFVSPKFVMDTKFRLMFLRSVYFDCKKAAKRIVSILSKRLFWTLAALLDFLLLF